MKNNIFRFAFCFAIQISIQTSVLTVIPLKTYALLGDLKSVSVLFFATGLVTALGRLFIPVLVKKFSHHQVLIGEVILVLLAVSSLATDETSLYVVALALFSAALAGIEIALTLFVLANVQRLQITRFERTRIFLSAIPWTIGPWLGVFLKGHVSEKAPFALSALLAVILLGCVVGEPFRSQFFRAIDAKSQVGNIWNYWRRYFAQPRLRLAWLLAFGRSAWWATFYTYVPILVIASGLDENISGLAVTAGTAWIWLVPLWSWLANRIYLRRLLIVGYLSTAVLTLVAVGITSHSVWLATSLLVLSGGVLSSVDAAGNTLFLRAVRAKERLEMAPVFATFRDAAQCAPPALFAVLLIFFPLPAVFAASGCLMLGMAKLAQKIPRTF